MWRVYCFSTPNLTFFFSDEKKRAEHVRQRLADDGGKVLVCDGHSIYERWSVKQRCWAHPVRKEVWLLDEKKNGRTSVAAEGSGNYFEGERGFSPIEEERTNFSLELANMKRRLALAGLTTSELEAIITDSDLRKLESVGGMPLREFGMGLADIAKGAFNHMKNRKQAPYLKPIHDPKTSRTEHYTLALKGSRS